MLERHIRNAHVNVNVKSGIGPVLFHNLEVPKGDSWYPCGKCNFKSKSKFSTERHKKTHLKSVIKPTHQCPQCFKIFSRAAKLKRHLNKCKTFAALKVGEEEVNELLSSGLNKTKVKTVLKLVRKISGKYKVQTNLMKTVNEAVTVSI